MDASTQTTVFSSDCGHSTVPNEEHEPQWSSNDEVGRDGGGARSGFYNESHLQQRDRAVSSNHSLSRIPSRERSGVAMPLKIGEISTSLSPSSSGETSPTDPSHPLELQKDEESIKFNGAMNDVESEDTAPQVEGIRISEQPLRRRPTLQSQVGVHILAAPIPQDSVVMQQETYLLDVCRALMMYGAPTYRLEEYMHRTARVLGLNLQSFYIPGCMIISFSDTIWRSGDVHIVRCTEALNLSKLDDVHVVYKEIIHKRLAVEEATARLDEIMTRREKFPRWVLVLMYGFASACIGPVSYGARPIDLPAIFLLGSLLGFMQLILADKSELYRHVFEISAAILTSFLARAFGSIHFGANRTFCFSAISQACLVMILPGFTITNSALELQSKNIVSGAVRMVYGIIFILFLAYGITIGITIYGAMDSAASSATQCAMVWPFWWQIIFVAPFTMFYILINQGKWKKAPAMVVLSLIGWTVNYFAAQRFSANTQIAQTLGALAVGILANIYSRLGYGLAVALMHPAIFIQVPGSLAASGSLISGLASADELNRGGPGSGNTMAAPSTTILEAGYAMIQIAIGITVGLSVSALVVYPFRKKSGGGLFSF